MRSQVSSMRRWVGCRGSDGTFTCHLPPAHQAEDRPHLPHHAQQQQDQQQAGEQADRQTSIRLPCICHWFKDQFEGFCWYLYFLIFVFVNLCLWLWLFLSSMQQILNFSFFSTEKVLSGGETGSGSMVVMRGLLWVQQDRIFCRWKERCTSLHLSHIFISHILSHIFMEGEVYSSTLISYYHSHFDGLKHAPIEIK